VVYGVSNRVLHHLRAMRRLFELAASGDLTMYHPKLKKEHRLGNDSVCDYLLEQSRWLDNELILSLVTGGNHPAVESPHSDRAGSCQVTARQRRAGLKFTLNAYFVVIVRGELHGENLAQVIRSRSSCEREFQEHYPAGSP
jgi:hypothetical protein